METFQRINKEQPQQLMEHSSYSKGIGSRFKEVTGKFQYIKHDTIQILKEQINILLS